MGEHFDDSVVFQNIHGGEEGPHVSGDVGLKIIFHPVLMVLTIFFDDWLRVTSFEEGLLDVANGFAWGQFF